MRSFKAISLISFLLIISCGPSRQEEAGKRLEEAINLKEQGNFNLAKLKLDTLISKYSEQTDEIEKAKEILKQININEQEKSLHFLDSMLVEQKKILDPLKRNFIISDEYGTGKKYIHRRQRPENSYNRTFLRAHINESGDFYISSRYHGTQWIHHEQIRVYYRGKSVTSEKVPEDGFNNRRFEDGNSKWEIVNYKNDKDNGIIDFIANNWEDPLRVQYIGQKHEYIILEKFDREAIRDGYEISFILKEIQKIKNEKQNIRTTLQKLKQL